MPQPNNIEEISPDGVPTGTVVAAPHPSTKPIVQDKPNLEKSVTPSPDKGNEGKDDTIDFSLFQQVKDGIPSAEAKPTKVEDKPIKIEVKPEDKVEDKIKIDDKVEDKSKVVPQQKVDTDGRDYSEFSDDEKGLFKRMSNEAFNKLKPVYLEHKALKSQLEETNKKLEEAQKGIVKLPDNYYEHPQGFILTPDFMSAQSDVNRAEQVFNHWSSQLEKVREGAKEIELLGVDQNGNFTITSKIPADTTAEIKLQSYFNFAQQQLMNAQASVHSLARNHTTRYTSELNTLKDYEKRAFAAFEDPKNKANLEPLVKSTLEVLPPAFRANPLATMVSKALVTISHLAGIINHLQNTKDKVEDKTVVKGGPSAAEAAGDGGGGNKDKENEVSIDDFNRVKSGY